MKISPSPPKSRANFVHINLLNSHKFSPTHLLIFLIFTLSVNSHTITPTFRQIPYAKHCNDVVPGTPSAHLTNLTLDLPSAIFSGRTEILGHRNSFLAGKRPSGFASFRTRFVFDTENDYIFEVEGKLVLKGKRGIGVFRRQLRMVSYRAPKIPIMPSQAVFKLHGFWNSVSGKMCMVGSGVSYLRDVNVILNLDYLNVSSIMNSFVNGTLRSLGNVGDKDYLKGIEILGISTRGYNYTMIESEKRNGVFSEHDKLSSVSLGFETSREVCLVVKDSGRIELVYSDDCGAGNCKVLGGGSEIVPAYMDFDEVECLDNGRVRYMLKLSNSSWSSFHLPFDPSTTLVAEGAWDGVKKHMDLVACQIVNATESLSKGSVGDCSIRLILRVPARFSLRNRSIIVGQMWSNKMVNESGYFDRVSLRSQENRQPRFNALKYSYDEYQNVEKICKKIKAERKGKTYPDGHTSDMRFDMIVRNKKGHTAWGYSSPLSVGDKFYEQHQRVGDQTIPVVNGNQSRSSMMNISYVLSFKNSPNFKLGVEDPSKPSVVISAEGIYDAYTGFLCMIGCRHLSSHNEIKNNNSLDCEIVITAEYPPLNAKDGGNVKGMIQSTRSKVDPQYFDNLKFHSNSVYAYRAKQSLWRMDLEITVVLFSNTLACIFVGLQLFYVYKHPDVLPFISVVMLVILTLAHMIPLLLNFEAMFLSNHMRQNVFSGTDGWLEVNEVLVRVITMIAFLMEFRLLQLTWSARIGGESLKNLWVSDKKVLYLSLPLYIGGGLIAWFVHMLTKPAMNIDDLLGFKYANSTQISLLGELKSFAGLVLDVILLPQILFNLFCDSTVKALAHSFYVGTTLLRLLPHAYDLYRSRGSSWAFTYIYANPRMDYYSTIWDIGICCVGVLFVFIIFLQQQFGGRFFLPRRYRENSLYAKVPVTGTE